MQRDEALRNLQRLDRQMQQLVQQRNTYEAQRDELLEARRMVEKATGRTYKIIANLLVEREKEALLEELNEHVKKIDLRLKLLAEQEKRLLQEMEMYQKKIQGGRDGSTQRGDQHS